MEAVAAWDPSLSRAPEPTPSFTTERVMIRAADGYALAGHRFAPLRKAHAAVVLPAAMGVGQAYYRSFAEHLAAQGFAVLTFDYRGTGESAPRRLRGFKATLDDCARLDYDAALREARAFVDAERNGDESADDGNGNSGGAGSDAAPAKLFVVGHSLGGQLIGMVPSRNLIDGVVTIACGSGYWRENTPQLLRRVWLMWYFAVPVYTLLAGYFPGRRVRKVGDLPKGVILQWSRWCRDRDYLVGAEGPGARAAFADVRCPMLSLSFTDDEMMSARNTESLHGFYVNAQKTMRRIAPSDIGVPRIGHFGFFRTSFRDSLWREATQWLRRQSAA